ncbi:HAD-like protein [Hysterangium stoloniferum]|nr:HAD-like protein [Hysterangium stoloniferum]
MPVITVDAILFDMDGTLIDSTPGVVKAWGVFGKEYNFDPVAACNATHGVRLSESLRTWCNVHDESKIKDEAVRFEYEVLEGGVIVLPGVHDLLHQIRTSSSARTPGWTIVTSATNVYTSKALDQCRLEGPQYAPLITADDVPKGKPDPAPYLTGAKALGVDPRNCLVVEDAVSGIISGKAAGARVLAVTTSTTREVVATAEPDWIVSDLKRVSAKWVDGKIELTICDE